MDQSQRTIPAKQRTENLRAEKRSCQSSSRQIFVGFESALLDPTREMAMVTRESYVQRRIFKNKDRPFCTHCKMVGHTIEKCYKLHGYPPGSQQRFRAQSNFVNVKTDKQEEGDSITDDPSDSQCQRLFGLLSERMKKAGKGSNSGSAVSKGSDVNLATFTTGSFHKEDDWQGLSPRGVIHT